MSLTSCFFLCAQILVTSSDNCYCFFAVVDSLLQNDHVGVMGRGRHPVGIHRLPEHSVSFFLSYDPSGGWSGGAMVLGKLPVPGRPTNLDKSRARAYCACIRCGRGCLDIFLSSIISLFFLSLSGRRPDID